MEVKLKAKELVGKFINVNYLKDYEGMHYPLAKECALIAVDEILKLDIYKSDQYYFEEVKQEIQKL